MKKVVAAYIALALVLTVISCCLIFVQPQYRGVLYSYSTLENVTVTSSGSDVATFDIQPQDDGTALVIIQGNGKGEGTCTFELSATIKEGSTYYDSSNPDYNTIGYSYDVEITPLGTILVNDEIPGGVPALACSAIFLFVLAVGLLVGFVRRKRQGLLCTYRTVSYLAFFIFVITCVGTLCFILSLYLPSGGELNLSTYLGTMAELSLFFTMLTVPFVLLAAFFLALSNISLIRHEGFRPVNMLGIAAGVFLIIIYAALFLVQRYVAADLGLVGYALNIAAPYVINLCDTIFLATAICGLMAAHNKPKFNKDYVLILGCGIRSDGTPTPLLAGRIKRALEFARAQQQQAGKFPVLVCSGGQGPDEVISEAASMANYLQEQGVEKDQILLEEKSTSTWENMTFSRQIIADAEGGEANQESAQPKVAFSTTNYHVFRSGTFALNAGLDAEGMGAKTVWYFWPNAFLREFVSFLVTSKAPLLVTVLIILAFSFGLSAAHTFLG